MLWMIRTLASIGRLVKRSLKIFLFVIAIIAVATTITVLLSGDSNFRYALPETVVNDVTKINPIQEKYTANSKTEV